VLAAGLATPLRAQGFAGLSGSADGFRLPRPDPHLQFPADHGPHPEFRLEWWYVTANLTDESGRAMGVQWTLFRSALAPGEAPGWASPQIWFAHAAMTRSDRHLVAERRARGGIGTAGVSVPPFRAWIDDWTMSGQGRGDALDHLALKASGGDWGYELALTAEGPLVLQGQDGYSVKSGQGQASYYYSQPFYRVAGRLDWPDGTMQVTGRAWADREWSSQPLGPDQTGWDWFALHLEGGCKLMIYRLRNRTGGGFVTGSWIEPGGRTTPLAHDNIALQPVDHTYIDGRRIPTSWAISLPERRLGLQTEPLNPRAWMTTAIPYWEGPVRVTGNLSGVGYQELTGYA